MNSSTPTFCSPIALSMPGSGLQNARGGWPLIGWQRDSLGHESADPLERDDLFEFDSVAEGAAGGDHRVDQRHAGQLHFHIGFHVRADVLSALVWCGSF